MGNAKSENDRAAESDRAGENKLRGRALDGPEQKSAADHTTYAEKSNPDTIVRVDNEEDTLYDDGLELDDDTPPMGTKGNPS